MSFLHFFALNNNGEDLVIPFRVIEETLEAHNPEVTCRYFPNLIWWRDNATGWVAGHVVIYGKLMSTHSFYLTAFWIVIGAVVWLMPILLPFYPKSKVVILFVIL